MRQLTNFQATRFANSVRFVFINLCADYLPHREALSKLISQKEGSSDSDHRKKETTALRRTINLWEFCLCLSGCSDIYDLYGELANVCQKVDILPHEWYDKATALIEKFSTMMKSVDHSDCPNEVNSNKKKCMWPQYHKDLDVAEKEEKYMGKEIDNINTGHVRQTWLQSSTSGEMKITDGASLARERLVTLTWRLHRDLQEQVLDNDVKDLIEFIRNICDMKTHLLNIREKGNVLYGLESSEKFLNAVRKVTGTLFEKCYRRFLCKLELFFQNKNIKNVDSIAIIKIILDKSNDLFRGVKIVMRCIYMVHSRKYSRDIGIEV